MKKPEQIPEKHKAITWKKLWENLRRIGLATSAGLALTLSTSCKNTDSDLTKLSKEHDDAIENVTTQEKELKSAQEEFKKKKKKVRQEQKDVIDAKNKERELRIELQKAKVNPSK